MSDTNVKEAKRQDRLARSYKDYLVTVVFCVIGWFMVNMGLYGGGRAGQNGALAFIGIVPLNEFGTVTVIGEEVENDGFTFTPVEYQGQRGWVSGNVIEVKSK